MTGSLLFVHHIIIGIATLLMIGSIWFGLRTVEESLKLAFAPVERRKPRYVRSGRVLD